jgi:plasmid stabilization system protein ParE
VVSCIFVAENAASAEALADDLDATFDPLPVDNNRTRVVAFTRLGCDFLTRKYDENEEHRGLIVTNRFQYFTKITFVKTNACETIRLPHRDPQRHQTGSTLFRQTIKVQFDRKLSEPRIGRSRIMGSAAKEMD